MQLLLTFLISLVPTFVFTSAANLTSVSIDDFLGDELTTAKPAFHGSCWSTSYQTGQVCNGQCRYSLDRTKLYDGTWSEGLVDHSQNLGLDGCWMSFNFTGVSIQLFFVGLVTGNDTSHATFYLDSQLAGETLENPTPGPNATFDYNEVWFAKDGLNNTNHTFEVWIDDYPGDHGLDNANVVLFDKAVYQMDNSSSSLPSPTASAVSSGAAATAASPASSNSSGSTSTGDIAGATVGGIIAVALVVTLGAGFLFYRRKHKKEVNSLKNQVNRLEAERQSEYPVYGTTKY